MCGICGIVGAIPDHDRVGEVARMNDALGHRGPDDHGAYGDEGIDVGMSRLAVIDVEGGHQPAFAADRRFVVVFNGEIYNHCELRAELEDDGCAFRTRSDTEVLAQGYARWGADLPGKLAGMFAFAVWDTSERRLFLARDRFGEKPLYYTVQPGPFLAFSSEIQSLLTCASIPRKADPEALGYYLRLSLIPEPMTGLEGVLSLPPGHTLVWREGRMEVRPFHTLSFEADPALASDGAAREAVEAALQRAVARQAISDVPLGAFLSGGIDSSTVTALLQRHSSSRVKTFTVRFEDAMYDESPVARETAAHLGTEHHEIRVPNLAFDPEHLYRIVDHVGMPFYDSSALPTYELSRRVREHVTVALSGDGGDEMFAGYPFFRWGLAIRRLRHVPAPILAAGARAAGWLGARPALSAATPLRRARRVLDAASVPESRMPAVVHSLFEPRDLDDLVGAPEILDVATGELDAVAHLPDEASEWSPLRRLMYYRMAHNLPCDMLVKVDRMSMACSLEVRAPMLDVEVADVACRLPDRQLVRLGRGKHVLREVARPLLPAGVFGRPKSGFSIPLHKYLNDDYAELASSLLAPDTPVGGLLRREGVQRVVSRALTTGADRADVSVYRATHQLWSLVVLAAWATRFRVST